MRTACKALSVLATGLLGACSAAAQRSAALPSHPATAREPADYQGVSAKAVDQGQTPNAELLKQGYRVMRRGQQLVYCRTQTQTGSLISRTVCLTENQLRWLDQNAQRSRDLLNQPRGGRNCPRADCSNNGG